MTVSMPKLFSITILAFSSEMTFPHNASSCEPITICPTCYEPYPCIIRKKNFAGQTPTLILNTILLQPSISNRPSLKKATSWKSSNQFH